MMSVFLQTFAIKVPLYKTSHLNYIITLRSIKIVSILKTRERQWRRLFNDFCVSDTVFSILDSFLLEVV